MANELDPLSDVMRQIDADGVRPHPPSAFYSPEGDCVLFYAEDVEHYGQRVDEFLTVFRATNDDRIVGCEIKHAKRWPELPVAALLKDSPRVDLVVVVAGTYAKLYALEQPARDLVQSYRDVLALAQQAPILIELDMLSHG